VWCVLLCTSDEDERIKGSALESVRRRKVLGAGDWRLETGDWRLETGDWRLETGDWRLETGDWRLETGDWRKKEEFLSFGEVGLGCHRLWVP
jgi:hypothetical protein